MSSKWMKLMCYEKVFFKKMNSQQKSLSIMTCNEIAKKNPNILTRNAECSWLSECFKREPSHSNKKLHHLYNKSFKIVN